MKLGFLSEALTALNGDVLKESNGESLTFGRAIAATLVVMDSKEGREILKAHALSKKFYSEEAFELDLADLQIVKRAVEQSAYNTMVKGQVLEKLEVLPSQ